MFIKLSFEFPNTNKKIRFIIGISRKTKEKSKVGPKRQTKADLKEVVNQINIDNYRFDDSNLFLIYDINALKINLDDIPKVMTLIENLKILKDDIRNTKLIEKELPGHDIFIHLACISNDPSFELNPKLGKSINLDSFLPLVEISKESKVKRFIYASSSSVYGVKKEKDVHEQILLEPLTDYSKYKMECEKILLKFNVIYFFYRIIHLVVKSSHHRVH